ERAALIEAPRNGTVADSTGVGPFQTAHRLCDRKVAFGSVTLFHQVRSPKGHEPNQFRLVELVAPALADAGRNISKKLIDERLDTVFHVAPHQIRPQKPDAAVDVVADPSRGDHTTFLRVGSGHAADTESIAPVDVRHGQACRLNS